MSAAKASAAAPDASSVTALTALIGEVFDLFDVDHDGQLTESDFVAVDRALGATDTKASAAAYTKLHTQIAPKTIGQITKAEYVACRIKGFVGLTAEQLKTTVAGLQAQIAALSKVHGHNHGSGGGHGHGHGHSHGEHGHSHAGGGGHGHEHDDHSHSDRSKMLAAESKGVVAWLTAHLSSKDGNELDVFFEAKGKPGVPLAITASNLPAAIVVSKGPGAAKPTAAAAPPAPQSYAVMFEAAPAEERPAGESGNLCSHFVAKTPFLGGNSVLSASLVLPTGNALQWANFVPLTYAHHQD